MLRSLLVVSRDESLLNSRLLVLGLRGFPAVGTTSIDEALKTAKSTNPAVVIICHTFSLFEQSRFVTNLRRVCPTAVVMRLKIGEVAPEHLIADCELCFMPTDLSEEFLANAAAGLSICSGSDTRAEANKLNNLIEWPIPSSDRARP
jgi:hypothetical protein